MTVPLYLTLRRNWKDYSRILASQCQSRRHLKAQQAIQDQINTVRLALMNAHTVMDKALAQGIVNPTVTALTDAAFEAIQAAMHGSKDGGAGLVSNIVDAVASGRLSMDRAATLFTDPMIKKLQDLEKEYTVDLANAYIKGTDPSGILANLKIVDDMLQQVKNSANDATAAIAGLLPGTYVEGKGVYQGPGGGYIVGGNNNGLVGGLPQGATQPTASTGQSSGNLGNGWQQAGTLVNYGTVNVNGAHVDTTTALLNDLGVH